MESIMTLPSMRVPVGRNGTARGSELDRPRAAADDVLARGYAREDLHRAPIAGPDADHAPLEGFTLDLDKHDGDATIIHERGLGHGEYATLVSLNEIRADERSDGEASAGVIDGEQDGQRPRNRIHDMAAADPCLGG